MNLAGYIGESICDGPNLRAVVFISYCEWNCLGCHNMEAQNKNYGENLTKALQDDIIEDIQSNPLIEGLTISGGDPFFSATEVLQFIRRVKNCLPNLNIWIYTGYTWEQLIHNKQNDRYKLLCECDVVVDGKFELDKRDITLKFKGSTNQRCIWIKESINENKIIEWRE